jgi:hypothetical protein
MTKKPRDHRAWTNEEIEQDSEGYLAAQVAFAEDQDEADRQRREADDLARFEEAFVNGGGSKNEAAAAYKAHKNRRAAEAAARADQEALIASQHHIRGNL